jgi:iron(III) transport system ATP-binding protein
LAGRVIEGPDDYVAPERRNLGYVAQEGALFPHLDVAANVGFGLRRRGRAERVTELLDLVGLVDLAHRYPHELSGGQQQRVALARALASRPPVVLLDEPFSSLDTALRASVRTDVANLLRAAGTAVVLVTHDQQEALSMADQVAVLRNGRIVQAGHPRELYSSPVDAELAYFLGDANLIDAQVHDGIASTPLGQLTSTSADTQHGRALVRPEQIQLVPGRAEAGLLGCVTELAYLGHESIITVTPMRPCGTRVIRVRMPGPAVYSVGAEVTLIATGTTQVWPAD